MSAPKPTAPQWRSATIWLRLLSVSPAARFVYIALSSALEESATRLPPPPGVSLAVLASFAGVPEADAKTYVADLVHAGLLDRQGGGDPEGGELISVVVPHAAPQTATPRQIAARINGSKGGRPRKVVTPAEQTSMLMPIDGGLSRGLVGDVAITSLYSKDSKEANKLALVATTEAAAGGETQPDYHRIGAAAREAAGFRSTSHYGVVRAWLEEGATGNLILDVIRNTFSPDARHLGYYGPAIRDAIKAASRQDETRPSSAWHAELDAWSNTDRGAPPPRPTDFPGAAERPASAAGERDRAIDLAKRAWRRDIAEWSELMRECSTSAPMPRLEDYVACAAPELGAPEEFRNAASRWVAEGCRGRPPRRPDHAQQARAA